MRNRTGTLAVGFLERSTLSLLAIEFRALQGHMMSVTESGRYPSIRLRISSAPYGTLPHGPPGRRVEVVSPAPLLLPPPTMAPATVALLTSNLIAQWYRETTSSISKLIGSTFGTWFLKPSRAQIYQRNPRICTFFSSSTPMAPWIRVPLSARTGKDPRSSYPARC
jgi:hypothetical protein